nr:hypothetical protein [Bdellovibrionales bacterium]
MKLLLIGLCWLSSIPFTYSQDCLSQCNNQHPYSYGQDNIQNMNQKNACMD